MDDFGVDRTIATLESALTELTLDAESRPTKRLRIGEAKLAQQLTDDTLAKRVDHVTSTKVPPYFTTDQWRSLVSGSTGVTAKDLFEKLGVTSHNFEEYKTLFTLYLEEGDGRHYLKHDAPHRCTTAIPLTVDEIKGLIPSKGIWMCELLQKRAVSSNDSQALVTVIRQIASLKNETISLRDSSGVEAEEEVDDSDVFYTNVVYNSHHLSIQQLRTEHENMQHCIDQLRETSRSQASTNAGLRKRINRISLDQYSSIAA